MFDILSGDWPPSAKTTSKPVPKHPLAANPKTIGKYGMPPTFFLPNDSVLENHLLNTRCCYTVLDPPPCVLEWYLNWWWFCEIASLKTDRGLKRLTLAPVQNNSLRPIEATLYVYLHCREHLEYLLKNSKLMF